MIRIMKHVTRYSDVNINKVGKYTPADFCCWQILKTSCWQIIQTVWHHRHERESDSSRLCRKVEEADWITRDKSTVAGSFLYFTYDLNKWDILTQKVKIMRKNQINSLTSEVCEKQWRTLWTSVVTVTFSFSYFTGHLREQKHISASLVFH